MDKQNRVPVGNNFHARVTDINIRLRSVHSTLDRVLDRLRPPQDCESRGDKTKEISNSVLSKLNDTGDLIIQLESLAEAFDNIVGVADEDVPKAVGYAKLG